MTRQNNLLQLSESVGKMVHYKRSDQFLLVRVNRNTLTIIVLSNDYLSRFTTWGTSNFLKIKRYVPSGMTRNSNGIFLSLM